MKKTFFILSLILIGIMVLIGPDETQIYENSAIIADIPSYHTCIDSTHAECDGKCECDGLGCNKSLNP